MVRNGENRFVKPPRPFRAKETYEGQCICGQEFSTEEKEITCPNCGRKLDFNYFSPIEFKDLKGRKCQENG